MAGVKNMDSNKTKSLELNTIIYKKLKVSHTNFLWKTNEYDNIFQKFNSIQYSQRNEYLSIWKSVWLQLTERNYSLGLR